MRNRVFSSINILGLGLAMSSSMMIFKYCYHELSFDSYHEDASNLFRVQTDYVRNGEKIFDSAENFAGAGPALKSELPAVEEFARLYNAGAKYNTTFIYKDNKFVENAFLYADNAFLSMFTVDWVAGNEKNALLEPNTAVITESTAKKYFGSADPIGKTLKMIDDSNHSDLCTVTGVIKDIPNNSHLKFAILFSYKTLYSRRGGTDRFEDSWRGRDNFYTYLRLTPGTDIKEISGQFREVIDKYKPSYTEVGEDGQRIRTNNFELISIRDIHLNSSLKDDPEVGGNADTIYFLICIGIFILLIAWINYINLATSKALDRAKEVGIRKFLGSSKLELAKQFLLEALLINIMAILLAATVYQLFAPVIGNVVGLDLIILVPVQLSVVFVGLLLLGGICSGAYPALVLTGFNPWSSVQSSTSYFSKGKSLRKYLVIFQFFISFVLMIGTIAVYQQVKFMKSKDLGFNPDQILVIKNPSLANEGAASLFRQNVVELANVSSYTTSSNIPGRNLGSGIVFTRTPNADLDKTRSITYINTDQQLIDTYELRLVNGRNFDDGRIKEDSAAVILNRSAVEFLDFTSSEEALGEFIYLYGTLQLKVIGVVNDYHHQSAQYRYEPIIFTTFKKDRGYFSMKVGAANVSETIQAIGGIWNDAYREFPFEYFFVDDTFNHQYEKDQQFNAIFSLFSILTLTISGLGLFGFSLFRVAQRTKEIGIRKALGASVMSIFATMTKEFLILILVAIVIAIPISYWLITYWLSNYAFRMDISFLLFAFPVLTLLIIALISISVQTVKVATMSPVHSLKYE